MNKQQEKAFNEYRLAWKFAVVRYNILDAQDDFTIEKLDQDVMYQTLTQKCKDAKAKYYNARTP